jgi:lipoic acid synthetase
MGCGFTGYSWSVHECPSLNILLRELSPATRIEILVSDFRGRLDIALDILGGAPPDVMNHNLETVPRLYKQARHANIPTKSGLMVGLGETDDEILQTMHDLRAHDVEMLTIGQYLAPSTHHLPVTRYVHPDVFAMFARNAIAMGFTNAASAPLVRSSHHADAGASGRCDVT